MASTHWSLTHSSVEDEAALDAEVGEFLHNYLQLSGEVWSWSAEFNFASHHFWTELTQSTDLLSAH